MLKNEEGTALLEFSLVLPFLVLFLWGILSFALYVMESQIMHLSAFTAARVALTNDSPAGEAAAASLLSASQGIRLATQPTREFRGYDLAVKKHGKRIEVEIGREKPWFSYLGQLLKRQPVADGVESIENAFHQLSVKYAIGGSGLVETGDESCQGLEELVSRRRWTSPGISSYHLGCDHGLCCRHIYHFRNSC